MQQQSLKNVKMIDQIIAFSKAYDNWSDKSFSLDEVNHILMDNWQEDDFNAFDMPITTKEQFKAVVEAAKEAQTNPKAPWLKINCECGNPITLSHRELLWRRKMGIALPCMCKDCRNICLGKSVIVEN